MSPTTPGSLIAGTAASIARLALKALPDDVSRDRREEVLLTLREVLAEQQRNRSFFSAGAAAVAELLSLSRFVLGAWTADLIPELKGSDRMRLVFNDLSQAVRCLKRRPGYSSVAILILAVGIGAGTAIFSVLDPVLLRADSFDQEKSLVYLNQRLSHADIRINHHPAAAMELYKDASTLEGAAAFTTDTTALFDGTNPERVNSSQIDADLLPLLRTSPILGRNFTLEERGQKLALIGEGLWRERLGASTTVLGETIELNDVAHEIVGVMPADFTFPDARTRIWTPFQEPEQGWDRLNSSAVARVAKDVELDTATEQLSGLVGALDQQMPVSGEVLLRLHTRDGTDGNTKATLWTLFGAVGILLLTACANAANLALTHTTGRKTELAIRRALGASRHRLTRQLLCESAVLSFIAAVVGYGLAQLAVPPLLRLAPESVRLPAQNLVTLDLRVMGFSLLVAAIATVLTGIFPAMRATLSVWASQHRVVGANTNQRAGTVLATAQVALAFVLLLAAGLLLRSFDQLVSIEPGFETSNVLLVDFNLETDRYQDEAAVRQFYGTALERIEALPFVENAATANGIPPRVGVRFGLALQAEGNEPLTEEPTMSMPSVDADPDYFSLMQIPLASGTSFQAEAQDEVVISQSVATRLFGDNDPIGKRIRMSAENPWLTVVGVATEVQQSGPRHTFGDEGEVYFPLAATTFARRTLMVKTDGDPLDRVDDIRAAIAQVDVKVPMSRIRTLEGEWADTMAKPRFLLEIIGILAGLTLLLTLGGLYSVLSYSVAKRTREIGVRMALGARAASVLWLVMKQGLLAAAIGIGLGLGVGRLGADLLQNQLFEISAVDPTATAATIAVVLGVVFLAAWIPASRATKVHPAVTLRGE